MPRRKLPLSLQTDAWPETCCRSNGHLEKSWKNDNPNTVEGLSATAETAFGQEASMLRTIAVVHNPTEGILMTDLKLAIPLFIAAAAIAGCKSTTDKPTNETAQDSAAALQLGKAKAATAEAAQAMEDYTYARKAEFVARMNKDLGVLQDDLNLLAARAESAGGAAKADAKAQLAAAREKWAKTKQQLDQTENATESTWNDVKRGFNESYAGLKDSVDTTRRWLSEKIAP